jgi:hypothetical protein
VKLKKAVFCVRDGASFFLTPLLLLNLVGPNWAVTGEAERTQDRQTDRHLGPGVLGTWVETQ